MTGNPRQIANKCRDLSNQNGRERHSYITSNETEFHFPAVIVAGVSLWRSQFARAREEVCEQWLATEPRLCRGIAEAQRLADTDAGKAYENEFGKVVAPTS